MTSPRREPFENLELASAVSVLDEFLFHDRSDGREKRAAIAAILALVQSGSGRTWHVGTTAPDNPQTGDGWFDTGTDVLRIWNGSAWEAIGPSSLDGDAIRNALNTLFGNDDWQHGYNPDGVVSVSIVGGAIVVTTADGTTVPVPAPWQTASQVLSVISSALDITDLTISTPALLESTLSAQETNAGGLLMYISADIDQVIEGVRHNYQAPTLAWSPPMSRFVNVLFTREQLAAIVNAVATATGDIPDNSIVEAKFVEAVRDKLNFDTGLKPKNYYLGDPADNAPFRVYQADDTPGITGTADLDGDYLLVFKNPRSIISGAISGNEDRINELRIFITNGGLSQVVHRVDPYTWHSTPQIIPFNISDAEESSVVSSITGNFVEFTIAPYLDNGAVGNSVTYQFPIVENLETNTALVRRLQSQTAGGNQRAFGNAAGNIAPQAEGNSNVPWSDTKIPSSIARQTAVQAARDAAAAAQLDADTVIEIGPEFIHNEVGPKVLGVSIRHPLNAYPTATVMTVAPFGQPAVIVGYDHTELHQDTLAEVAAVSLNNIWSATDEIDDGMGGTRNIQHFRVGSYIPVEVRLREGRNGNTVFIRVIDVLVIAAPAGTSLSDAEVGAKAFRNPPSDLTEPQKTAVRTSIGAGTPGGGGDGLDQNEVDARVRALALLRAGGTMTGALTLSGDPSANRHATTKEYVDSLFEAADNNFIVDDPDNPIAPTDDNADKILVRGGRLYENILHSQTDPVVAYRNFATSDLVGLTPRTLTWGGAVQTNPVVVAGTVVYSIPAAKFEEFRFFSGPGLSVWVDLAVPNWRGPAADKASADEKVTAVGDIVYYGGTVRVATSFTAGTTRHRTWTPIVSVPAESSVTFDTLASALLATQAEVASGEANKLVTAAIIKAYVEAFAPNLRTLFGTSATPVAQDRFWFSDENQAGDPIRYVTFNNLRAAFLAPVVQALTSAVAIRWDISRGDQADLTLGHNTTLQISGGTDGDVALLAVTQDTTGSRTLALHSSISRGGRDAPTLSTGAGEIDYLSFVRRGGTWRYLGIIKHG